MYFNIKDPQILSLHSNFKLILNYIIFRNIYKNIDYIYNFNNINNNNNLYNFISHISLYILQFECQIY